MASWQPGEPSLPGVWELSSCSVGLPESSGDVGGPAGRGNPRGGMQTSLLLMLGNVSVSTLKWRRLNGVAFFHLILFDIY